MTFPRTGSPPPGKRSCKLYSYAGLIRCVAEAFSNEPDWMVGLREKLRCKMEVLENSVT